MLTILLLPIESKAYHAAMDRHVAVKVLPQELADTPGFRKRFEREAKVVANLQHPHILPVFDYGEERSISYLVMPYRDFTIIKHPKQVRIQVKYQQTIFRVGEADL